MKAYVHHAYQRLTQPSYAPRLCLTTYFEAIPTPMIPEICQLPIHTIHLDLVRGPDQFPLFLKHLEKNNNGMHVSLGLINGRNIWKTPLDEAMLFLQQAITALGHDRVCISTSCSLLHCPYTVSLETNMDDEAKSWCAFAMEKLKELQMLTQAVSSSTWTSDMDLFFQHQRNDLLQRQTSPRIHRPSVKQRLQQLTETDFKRCTPYAQRVELQRQHLKLPSSFPITSVGSFPQTSSVRAMRAQYKKGQVSESEYQAFLQQEIRHCIDFQLNLNMDVLVHGEFERNDMVEYFGEKLNGCLITQHGWIQSFGTRCVKPPVIYGDVERMGPMTLSSSVYAQSLTDKPVKGMLTGPITLLQWSFVREDQPAKDTAFQLALVLRDEVHDLESLGGLNVIQVDEPALREGLPLTKDRWSTYLTWAVQAFQLATSGVQKTTQLHSHMCYSDFDDIMDALYRMDMDVLSVENAKSHSKLLHSLKKHTSKNEGDLPPSCGGYPRQLGPGIYDIHSPRVPSVEEMKAHLLPFLDVLAPHQLWVNPDCGLKTRSWEEVQASLSNLCQVAFECRQKVSGS
ncbi:hypothetical protein HMI55_000258 [Coelomomyces lativittatus]|nr:hypothetical protein HMI55_000258 [Coelomomyces lativittatus]